MGLALGFSVLGLLIVAKEQDGGASIIGGILGILLGAAFLIAACLHWKCCNQIQGGFQVEEVPAAEIISEMQQAAGEFLKTLNHVRVSVRIISGAGRRDCRQTSLISHWRLHSGQVVSRLFGLLN